MPDLLLGERARKGTKWGWLEPIPGMGESSQARRYSSLDLACDLCGAEIGCPCEDSSRTCASRIQEALRLMRAGLLDEAPEPERVELPPCDSCGVKKTAMGSPVACDQPGHRCGRILAHIRKQCVAPVVPNSRYCVKHVPPQQRFTDGAVQPSQPPRRWN